MPYRTFSRPTEAVRTVRQARLYHQEQVPAEAVEELLEIARWTGSARNTQPWHFIIVTDREKLRKVSQLRPPINWLADVPLAIALVMDGANPMSEAYDEGRVTERLLIAANMLGLGGGVAFFGDESQVAEGKRILGIPPDRLARSLVAIGRPTTTTDHRPTRATPGRKSLAEIVSQERYGARV